jgi:hypothetical protein
MLLNLSLGYVLVLRANHPEDRRSRILATGDWAQLLGPFSASSFEECKAGELGGAALAASATESALHGDASTLSGVAIEEFCKLTGEGIDE